MDYIREAFRNSKNNHNPISKKKLKGAIAVSTLAAILAGCGSNPTSPSCTVNCEPNPGNKAKAVGTVNGGYTGNASFGSKSGAVTGGSYSVSDIPITDAVNGDKMDGTFSGDANYLGRIALFLLKPGTNTFPQMDVLESIINGITIDPSYLGALVNRPIGGGRNPRTLEGVANWSESGVSEVLIVESSFFERGDLLRNLYIYNFKQNAIDNATTYIPKLLHENPTPIPHRIVNGNYSCDNPANMGKIIYLGATREETRVPGSELEGVGANAKWIDDNHEIYCSEILITDGAGPGTVHHESMHAVGREHTNDPSIPGVLNQSNSRTSTISDADVAYSLTGRKMKKKSKITNGMYDTRGLGTISGVITANSSSASSMQGLEGAVNSGQLEQPIVQQSIEQQSGYSPPPQVIRQRKDSLYRQR